MTTTRSYEQESRQEHLALLFTAGYSGSGLDSLIREWSRLMASAAGRAEALKRLKECAEPLGLPSPELVAWVAARKAGRLVMTDG